MVRRIYLALSGVLVLIGILGFIMPSPLFGLFDVNTLHNIIYLASGAFTLVAASQGIRAMRTIGRTFGALYLAVAIAGFVEPSLYGFMHVNLPDNLLHIGLAAIYSYIGFLAPPTL
jgi:hypothetical protein